MTGLAPSPMGRVRLARAEVERLRSMHRGLTCCGHPVALHGWWRVRAVRGLLREAEAELQAAIEGALE